MTERGGGKAAAADHRQRPAGPGAAWRSCPPPIKDAYLHAVASGTHQVFLWGAVISVVGFAAAWFVKEVPLRTGAKSADGEAPADAKAVAEPV